MKKRISYGIGSKIYKWNYGTVTNLVERDTNYYYQFDVLYQIIYIYILFDVLYIIDMLYHYQRERERERERKKITMYIVAKHLFNFEKFEQNTGNLIFNIYIP